jgi:hypothetical protein
LSKLSKEGIETDAKKQRRNYKIAMISGREVGCKIGDVEDETDLERDTRAFEEVRAAK